MALGWIIGGAALGGWEWRRRLRGFRLSLSPQGWYFQPEHAALAVAVVLAPKQWLYGPLLLLSVRLPGHRWPRQLWVSRDAMAPDEFRQLCRALLVGIY